MQLRLTHERKKQAEDLIVSKLNSGEEVVRFDTATAEDGSDRNKNQ